MKPTPKGRPVSDRAIGICSRSHDAPSGFVPPIIPKPPASETAAANSPVAVPAIEALRIGCSMPSNVQSRVVIMDGLRGRRAAGTDVDGTHPLRTMPVRSADSLSIASVRTVEERVLRP